MYLNPQTMGFLLSLTKFPGQLVVFEDLTALETAKEVAEQTQQFALAAAIDRELVTKWLEGPATDETHPETAGEKPNILDLGWFQTVQTII